ncbi:nuclear transport factor 2-like isoform X2 [Apium graveolens]|uniref:nuclear transport factor 2-like isoform X2 n=1 Tax=Apium graveolens TaxID=4045 RepID=UPI003D7922E2
MLKLVHLVRFLIIQHYYQMSVPAAIHLTPVFYDAETIGKAFAARYYYVLNYTPELAYGFYSEMSIISWPNSDGTMTSVTTLNDIHAKIQTLSFKNPMKIETVDAQDSFYWGIIVVVTGSFSGTDDAKWKFTQTFFLAPQGNGYFVLNDVFRCVKESGQLEINSKPVDCDGDNSPTAPFVTVSVVPSVTLSENRVESEMKAGNLFNEEKGSGMVKETVSERSNHIAQDGSLTVSSSDSSVDKQENRTCASIVKVPKVAASKTGDLKWTPTKNSPRTPGSPNSSAEPTKSLPISDIGPQSSNPQKSVEGYSIYIRNLPPKATVADVTEEFTKFGPINEGGVQVKIHKEYGYHFGFVEFQSLDSMQNAIKESPVTMWGRHVLVQEKKSSIRVRSTGDTGRFIPDRGNIQNRSFGTRGYFGVGGYGRNEFRKNHKNTSLPRSNSGTYKEYRRVDRSRGGEHGSDTGE